jgi:hypothetical protein
MVQCVVTLSEVAAVSCKIVQMHGHVLDGRTMPYHLGDASAIGYRDTMEVSAATVPEAGRTNSLLIIERQHGVKTVTTRSG